MNFSIRWFVILAALWALIRAILGWSRRRPWTAADNRSGLFFGIFLDTQVLLGLILFFFLSPITSRILGNFGGTRVDRAASYLTFEHLAPMLAALALAHIRRHARERRRPDRGNTARQPSSTAWQSCSSWFPSPGRSCG